MSVERVCHIFCYRLDGVDRFGLWYSGDEKEPDGLVVDRAGWIVSFGDLAAGHAYACSLGLALNPEDPILHDLDAVNRWLKTPRKRTINCAEFLAAWNVFLDAAQSVHARFDPDRARTDRIYTKLLWGSNLPALTPPGRCYEPIWTKSEIGIMQYVLGNGLSIFRRHLAQRVKMRKRTPPTDTRKIAKTNCHSPVLPDRPRLSQQKPNSRKRTPLSEAAGANATGLSPSPVGGPCGAPVLRCRRRIGTQ